MPIKPVDYSQTHFYKIVCKDLSIKDCLLDIQLTSKTVRTLIKQVIIIQTAKLIMEE